MLDVANFREIVLGELLRTPYMRSSHRALSPTLVNRA
jgi:hypothetical protein